MLRLIFVLFTLVTSFSLVAQLQTPSDFLGYDLGSYFSRHHQVVDYFEYVGERSDMVTVSEYGRTDENRKLITAIVSSSENMSNLDEIMRKHELGENEEVAVVWLSYNVHGNESSGTEAAMQTLYDLIIGHQEWLDNTVVIMDPCLNPDGRDRYVNWYNQYMTSQLNTNGISAEHDEPWPSGRFNHYLYDLNRDWAWLTQVETQQRIVLYNKWMPHMHADFHEMGANSPYYFAPAVAPFHEAITDWQLEYQTELGRNHAKYFDRAGWKYFTNEDFDLLYPGFGDTYPTFNGAIGVTYEQGGSGYAGLGIELNNGSILTLKDRVLHHYTVGLSTVEFASLNAEKLISEYQDFVKSKDYTYSSYVISGNLDKLKALIALMDLHDVQYSFGNGGKASGFDFARGENGSTTVSRDHLIISTNQKKGTLVNVLFEPDTKLTDSLTYDITAWSLIYAYGLDCIASKSLVSGSDGAFDKVERPTIPRDIYAYMIPWNSISGAQALAMLLQEGVEVRFAEKEFTIGESTYDPGTLIIVKGDNEELDLRSLIPGICKEIDITYSTTMTGMVDSGRDFGSSSVRQIPMVKVGLLTKNGRPERVGDVWHYFEEDLGYPLTLVDDDNLSASTLDQLDVLIVPSSGFDLSMGELTNWVRKGGKVIAIGSALYSFSSYDEFQLESKGDGGDEEEDDYANAHIPYDAQSREYIKYDVLGAIFKCKLDESHPLAFGYSDSYFTLRETSTAYNWLMDGANVAYIDEGAEAESGFVGSEAKDRQAKSLVFGVDEIGRGSIVYMVDNPIFRGFWENGKLFFANAVFLVR